MKKLVRECEYRLKSATPRQVSFPNTGSLLCFSMSNIEQKKRKGMNGPFDITFQKEAREQYDAEVARMFYIGGLSFHLVRNPHYRNSYLRNNALIIALPGYVPPSYNALRTTLLQQEKSHIELCIQPIKVITDNAPVCRAAGLLFKARYPNIFWTPCLVHTLNLALKSICSPKQNDDWYDKCSWILDIEGLQQMVISPNWSLYKDDDVGQVRAVKEKILDEYFWNEIDDIFSFIASIYEMIRMADIDKSFLHLVYE
ncbi:unnamed protein product [Prunus brigantina]